MRWIVIGIVAVVLVGLYVWMFLFARKRQQRFDAQYSAAKQRHEMFVLNKKVVRESARKKGPLKYARFKTYQVTGRISVSQSVKGMQMSKMQTVTLHTTKSEFEKIQVNHKYKMDIAGNYIGYVLAPAPTAGKGKVGWFQRIKQSAANARKQNTPVKKSKSGK